jgi:hypothetical protein
LRYKKILIQINCIQKREEIINIVTVITTSCRSLKILFLDRNAGEDDAATPIIRANTMPTQKYVFGKRSKIYRDAMFKTMVSIILLNIILSLRRMNRVIKEPNKWI